MKHISRTIAASLFAIAPLASASTVASAAIHGAPEAVVIKINSDGFRTCNSKKNSGNTYYRAKVRGFLIDGSGGGVRSDGNSRFSVTTCFDTAQSCKHWVKRITHTIPGVSKIDYTKCKARS